MKTLKQYLSYTSIFRICTIVILILHTHTDLKSEVVFKNSEEMIQFVHNLTWDDLKGAKPLDNLMNTNQELPDDPMLLKGIELFNAGKKDDAIKHFIKVVKKSTGTQCDYARYQIFHYEKFGMLDPYFNGRPSKMNREGLSNHNEYPNRVYYSLGDEGFGLAYLILSCDYNLASFDPSIWDKFCKDIFIFDKYYLERHPIHQELNKEDWLAIFKACYPRSREMALKNFPDPSIFNSYNDVHNYIEHFNPLFSGTKTIKDYLAPVGKKIDDPLLLKGLSIYDNSPNWQTSNKKAAQYFYKLCYSKKCTQFQKNYAHYQIWHMEYFDTLDPYYDGRPSMIECKSYMTYVSSFVVSPKYFHEKSLKFVRCNNNDFLLTLAKSGNFLNYCDKEDRKWEYSELRDIYDTDFMDALVSASLTGDSALEDLKERTYRAINRGYGTIVDYKSFNKLNSYISVLSEIQPKRDNYLGVGLNSIELYKYAEAHIPEEALIFDVDKSYKAGEKAFDIKSYVYLLRSANYGNPKAMALYLRAISSFINYCWYSPDNEKNTKRLLTVNKNWSQKLADELHAIKRSSLYNLHKDMIDGYCAEVEKIQKAHAKIYDEYISAQAAAATERKKKQAQARSRQWASLGQTLLGVLSNGANAYIQTHANSGAGQYSQGGKMSFQEQYNKYLSPEAFLYNYTHGLPTLPTSSEMGLNGSSAYAYDVQSNLQYRNQLDNLTAAQETQKLIEQGQKNAQAEIENFAFINGREPTAAEINAIYAKHTQGYIDSYANYVSETIEINKSLGLGTIEKDNNRTSNNSVYKTTNYNPTSNTT